MCHTDEGKNYLVGINLFFTKSVVPSATCTNHLHLNIEIQFPFPAVLSVTVHFNVGYITA